MAVIQRAIQPIASLSVGSVTLTSDPVGAAGVALNQNAWTTVATYTLSPEDVKNKSFQMLDNTVSWTGTISAGGTDEKWRVLLNDVAVNSQTPKGTTPAVAGYEMTFRLLNYAISNVIKIQAFTNAAGILGTATGVSISGRALTYV